MADYEKSISKDRFISPRSGSRTDIHFYSRKLRFDDTTSVDTSVDILNQDVREYEKEQYKKLLSMALGLPCSESRLLFSYIENKSLKEPMWPVSPRRRPSIKSPDAALDLPNFMSNEASSIIDWGANGVLAAALSSSVFLNYPDTNKTVHLIRFNDAHYSTPCYATAVKWDNTAKSLGVGNNVSDIQVWDSDTKKFSASAYCNCVTWSTCRINCLAWNISGSLLMSGCSQGTLRVVAVKAGCHPTRGQIVNAHIGEIALLSTSPDGQYIASLGTDKCVRVWKWQNMGLHFQIMGSQRITAIAWHPTKTSLLVVGGGKRPNTLSLHNVSLRCKIASNTPQDNSILHCLSWCPSTGELVASYWIPAETGSTNNGYTQIIVLKNLTSVVDKFMSGYQSKVHFLLWNPDGNKIATAGDDETLRIWKFLDAKTELRRNKKRNSAELGSLSSPKYVLR